MCYICSMPELNRTIEKKILKERITTFSKDIKVSNYYLEGTFSVTNVRFYDYNHKEVDVEFNGKIFVNFDNKRDWRNSQLLDDVRVSKIKVGKHIKKNIVADLTKRLLYFGVKFNEWDKIKKLKWK